jgi:hypothetical protein
MTHNGNVDFTWNQTQIHGELHHDDVAKTLVIKSTGQTSAGNWNVDVNVQGAISDKLATVLDSFSQASTDGEGQSMFLLGITQGIQAMRDFMDARPEAQPEQTPVQTAPAEPTPQADPTVVAAPDETAPPIVG